MEIAIRVSEIMPNGKADFKNIITYPTVNKLIAEHGKATMIKVLYMLVVDYCNTMNVSRNMTDEQQIEAAHMLMDECGNFRLEDYVMMFTMAKRGQLGVKLIDRIDLPIITQLMDSYWTMRDEEGKRVQENNQYDLDNEINSKDLTFAPVLSQVMTNWAKQTDEELQKEEAEKEEIRKQERLKQIQAFAELHNIDLKEINKDA